MKKLIECVPNISEGRDSKKIQQIVSSIQHVDGVRLLDVDPGKTTNRTVITFVGEPDDVVEAAFQLIQKAAECIDMTNHSGEHPRFGATDVCPFVPVANASMEDCIRCAKALGRRVGDELNIPVYLYEEAATSPERKNLASVRSGEYEGIAKKIKKPEWKPDFGPNELNAKTGNIAIGARDFLIAYNVNINTTSVRRANSIAFDVREAGRIKRKGNPITGEVVTDEEGNPVRIPGTCKGVKAIGWYIEEYGLAQISMNITNVKATPLHIAFDACVQSAHQRGMRVTGSELVGLVPLRCMLEAGKYFLKKQQRSVGVSESELVKIAVKSMGLDDLKPFVAEERIIEYKIAEEDRAQLVNMDLSGFANETASESPAPGGGSISAYVGALGVALGTMVANLSSHKRGWDDRWEAFSEWAEKGQQLKDTLLYLVDEDTRSFNAVMSAYRLPKESEIEKAKRAEAIQSATKYAAEVPFAILKTVYESFDLIRAMATQGNPNSITDAGVGALCMRTAIVGAYLNVKINVGDIEDQHFVDQILAESEQIVEKSAQFEQEIMDIVKEKI